MSWRDRSVSRCARARRIGIARPRATLPAPSACAPRPVCGPAPIATDQIPVSEPPARRRSRSIRRRQYETQPRLPLMRSPPRPPQRPWRWQTNRTYPLHTRWRSRGCWAAANLPTAVARSPGRRPTIGAAQQSSIGHIARVAAGQRRLGRKSERCDDESIARQHSETTVRSVKLVKM